MTLWTVTLNDPNESRVVGVFSTRELAEQEVKNQYGLAALPEPQCDVTEKGRHIGEIYWFGIDENIEAVVESHELDN